jgi:hypothetical protein
MLWYTRESPLVKKLMRDVMFFGMILLLLFQYQVFFLFSVVRKFVIIRNLYGIVFLVVLDVSRDFSRLLRLSNFLGGFFHMNFFTGFHRFSDVGFLTSKIVQKL